MDDGFALTREHGASADAPRPHVLVLDDDPAVRELIADYLGRNDLQVTSVASSREMAAVLAKGSVEALILDLRLQDEDGMQIARQLRALSMIPILMLTSRADEADRVMGLEVGADDYLTKPFSPRELLARVRALLRRARGRADARAGPRAFRFGSWELNLGLRKLKSADGRTVELSNGELALLRAFLSAPQRVLTRDELLDRSRLHGAEVYQRAIDVQILRLRRKIEPDPTRPKYICTARGAGYVFGSPVQRIQ